MATPKMDTNVRVKIKPNRGKIMKSGKLKVWTGKVPSIALETAVDSVRHYER
jgi:hypothetical protein